MRSCPAVPRRPRPRALGWLVPVVAPTLTILATADCYGPTEVTVIVSTDLGCSEVPMTGLFKGEPGRYDTTPQAETNACTPEPSGGGGTVGTLVLLPSGSPDGAAGVKVITTLGRKSPRDCLDDSTGCIIARRSFAFGEHLSRRLPVRMFRECAGVVCSESETCVGAPARCVSAETICDETSCLLASETPNPDSEGGVSSEGGGTQDGTTVLPDGRVIEGGPDPDAGPPVVTDCVSSIGFLTTATKFPAAHTTAASGTALYYVKGETPDRVYSISKSGGSESVVFQAAGNDARIKAIAYDSTAGALAVGWEDLGVRWVQPAAGAKLVAPSSTEISDVAVAPGTPPLYVATGNAIFKLDATLTTPGGQGADRLAVDTTSVFITTAAGPMRRLPRDLSANVSVTNAPTSAVYGRDAMGNLHAAGLRGGKGVIGSVSGTTFADVLAALDVVPQSLSVDAAYYFFHAGMSFYRAGRYPPAGQPVQLGQPETVPIDHVLVDADTNGCIYYWRAEDAAGKLMVRPKK